MAPLLDEVVIVEILLDDDARERVRENEIGTGKRREPQRRLGRRHGKSRVHDDELAAIAGVIGDVAPEQRVVRLGRIGAPEHEALGQIGPEVALDRPAVGHRVHPDARVPADGPNAHVVGTVDEAHEAVQWPVDSMRTADGARHRPRPMSVDEQAQARRNVVKCFVPAHADKTAAATRPYALQGIVDARVLVIELLEVEPPTRTASRYARIVGVSRRIGREVDYAAIFNRRVERAQIAAVMAIGFTSLSSHDP